ncbi:FAD-dependent oxidoreductase [Celeribacter neptunius]|uniref:Succinate dehydrogenase/fumarate reductase, flavoprotein subunit n=1 Tax=Celeribacter neptunius TaxID=588602 RepID=A0A1I3S3J1_9RHOB|nr:FAD-dependent oxidoreductase [Celeribacter neptunius]SFJ53354.1 Succinate dehydrogenase/fumarate reductase, flavoprotein subunit [Celeribacter neptunius]
MKHQEVDVLVVGSGAGGLSTAVSAAHRGLKVIVAEKESVFGGTTARSGGWSWIPNNAPGKRAGVEDSVDKARAYLKHETGDHYDSAKVEAFLEAGPKAVDFFENKTALQFDLGPTFSDYHPTAPGGLDGGRSIVARPFDGRDLGKEIKRLRPPLREITVLGMMIGSGKELLHFFNVTRSPISALFVTGLVAKFARDVTFHGRSMRLMNGNALIARLAKSCFDKNVPIWTSSPVKSLLRNDDGSIKGAIVNRPDGPVEIIARKGVVLAAGGFPQDAVRRKELMPHAPSGHEHVSPAPPGNTGDGLRLAESAGASIKTDLPNSAAWVPVSRPPMGNGLLGTFPHFVDRSKPGVIAVTRSGKRFVNEAQSYHDFCQAMVKRCREEDGPDGELAAWFVADHRTFRKYGLGFAKPAPVPYKSLIKQGYLIQGKTIRDLAEQIGADPAQMERTVAEFNKHAVKGEDPEFGKGSTAYNRSLGDPDHKPNPCVAPVKKGPFYAVRLYVGDLGTFAGMKTNEYSQVLSEDGKPIGGLYAAGNDAASIMGGNYPGGGITLGPALTFGYIAARHMAGANS